MSKAKKVQPTRRIAKPAASHRGHSGGPSIAITDRGPSVSPEQRRRLAECCAFFKAEHYREATPDEIRKSDVKLAKAQIDAAIRRCCRT